MKKYLKDKKILFIFIILLLLIVVAIIFLISKILNSDHKNSDYNNIQEAISNIFYYLPNDEYNDMNDISDYCKIALVYGTSFLESDGTIYDPDGTKIDSYSIINIIHSLKTVLGSNASINVKADENGDYAFLKPDNCQFGNIKASNLSFDSENNLIYALDEIELKRKVYVKWTGKFEDGNRVTLTAQALMAVEGENGYDLYVDFNMATLIGHYDTASELDDAIRDNYYQSYDYEFTLTRTIDGYIWNSFVRNKNDFETIID